MYCGLHYGVQCRVVVVGPGNIQVIPPNAPRPGLMLTHYTHKPLAPAQYYEQTLHFTTTAQHCREAGGNVGRQKIFWESQEIEMYPKACQNVHSATAFDLAVQVYKESLQLGFSAELGILSHQGANIRILFQRL